MNTFHSSSIWHNQTAVRQKIAAHLLIVPEPRFGVTFFRNFGADTKREEFLTYNELAQRCFRKHDGSLLKLATFGDTRSDKAALRHDGNLLEIWGVEIDYDGGLIDFKDACERLTHAGVRSIIHTTKRYTRPHTLLVARPMLVSRCWRSGSHARCMRQGW